MAKRQTIGENPLDNFLQPFSVNNETEIATMENVSPTTYTIKKTCQKKQRITVQISEEVVDRIKNAVYWTPGITLASLAEEAFATIVDKLEAENGEPFTKRREELKTGRPIS